MSLTGRTQQTTNYQRLQFTRSDAVGRSVCGGLVWLLLVAHRRRRLAAGDLYSTRCLPAVRLDGMPPSVHRAAPRGAVFPTATTT